MDKNQQKAKFKEFFRQNGAPFLLMMGIFLILIVGLEALFRKSLWETLSWVINEPFLFAMNFFTLLLIASILLLITKRITWVTFGVSLLTIVLSAINIGKYQLRNVPLVYEDLFLIKEVWMLMPVLVNSKNIMMLVFGLIGAILLAVLLVKFFKKYTLHRHRFLSIGICLISAVFLMVGQNVNSADIVLSKSGFIYSLSNVTREKPIVLAESLEEAQDSYTSYLKAYNQKELPDLTVTKPNIIIIQSEAFWDINRLNLKFNQNPIPFYESLRKKSVYGDAYVPVFGGGTANTEYEVLTGLTMKNFYSDWYMVYPNEIKQPTVSLASILRQQGYHTEGLHPYMSWYYNRLAVYNYLGFNTFKTIEFMNNIDIIGAYMSDAYITDLIIDSIEKTDAPLFNFTVTMQNHGPYGNHRFSGDEFDVKVQSELTDSSRYFLSNYAQGLYLTDVELERLVTYLESSDEPTILLFFGDHLPMLGEDYQLYREVGYVDDETTEMLQQDLRMMSVPYVIWSNFDQTSEEMPAMNISYISSLLLERAGVNMPDYLKVTAMMREDMPLYLKDFGVDRYGNRVEKDSTLFKNTQSLYYKLHQDLKSDEVSNQWLIKSNGDYNKTLTDITIESAQVEDTLTTVSGGPFYQGMLAYLNGKETSFVFESDSKLILEVPLKTGDTLSFRLLDNEGRVLAVSKGYQHK